MKTLLFVTTTIAVSGLAICYFDWFADSTTTQSLSPDEAYRIYLVESRPNLPLKIDRNFKIILAPLDKDTGGETAKETLFRSPDEGRPIGSERFIWSKDSIYVLLVGRHFMSTDLRLADGEQAYFLYHLPSKRSWCSSKQASGTVGTLSEANLQGIDFVQPVVLQKPDNNGP